LRIAGNPAVMARCTIDGRPCLMIDFEAMRGLPFFSPAIGEFAGGSHAIVPSLLDRSAASRLARLAATANDALRA
jgi:hypothetical protein